MVDPVRQIVVGVDGSKSSIDALRWAVFQAELTGATLHVIAAWPFPENATPFGIIADLPFDSDPRDEVRARLDEVIATVVPQAMRARVRAEAVLGNAASALLEAARTADLLVVGSRGRGAFAELLLGSVSGHCVRHATCPVVVVRHDGTRSATQEPIPQP